LTPTTKGDLFVQENYKLLPEEDVVMVPEETSPTIDYIPSLSIIHNPTES